MLKLLGFLCVSIFLMNCKPDGETPPIPADTAASFSLSSPPTGLVYPNGTTIQVTGNVSDPNGIKKVVLEIKHKTNGTVYYTQNVTLGNVTFHFFHWTWMVTGISTLTTATVKIVSTDRFDYQSTKEVDVQLDN